MLFSSKDLRKLIIPLMFEQLLAVLVGLVDTLMVSQSGEAAVAGVALVDNINRLTGYGSTCDRWRCCLQSVYR